MKREIKFRVWNGDAKQFADPNDFVLIGNGQLMQIERESAEDYPPDLVEEEGGLFLTYPQGDYIFGGLYTGLKDKNGKEIYERDVVRWDDESDGEYWRVCEIKWRKAHYTLVGYSHTPGDPDSKHPVSFDFGAFIYERDGELEVIGNIYENPEPIK